MASGAAETDPQISVVIPTFNRGHLIGRAIESVLWQSRQPAEIIVVDDGSTDDTQAQVAAFGRAVKYLFQQNSGASMSRNRGVAEASSEWIAFLDSDDLWAKDYLARMSYAIRVTSGMASFYFADTKRAPIEGGGYLWALCDFEIKGDYELFSDATNVVLRRRQPMMLQSSIFKRADYLESGGFWERLRTREDTHLFLKLGIGRTVCAVAGCGAQMTADDHPNNRLTSAHGQEEKQGIWMQVLLYKDILNRMNLNPADKWTLQTRLAGAYRRLARLAWREHRLLTAVQWAGKSAIVAPGIFFNRLGRRISRIPKGRHINPNASRIN